MSDERLEAQKVAQKDAERLQISIKSKDPSIAAAAFVAVAEKNADKYDNQAQNLQAEQAAELAKLARKQLEQLRAERKQSRAEREQSKKQLIEQLREQSRKEEETELNDWFFKSFGGRTSKKRHINIKNKYNKKRKITKRRRTRKSKKVYKK